MAAPFVRRQDWEPAPRRLLDAKTSTFETSIF
jgi:hypothetical protein